VIYDSPAQQDVVEKRRLNSQFVALNVLLNEPDYLSQQILSVASVWRHFDRA